MKKILVLGLVVVLATGCSNNKLVCSKNNSKEKVKETISITFKDKKASSIEMTQEYQDKNTAKEICDVIKTLSKENKEKDVKYSCDGNKMTIKSNNISKITGSNNYKKTTKEEFKKDAEKDGYTCK